MSYKISQRSGGEIVFRGGGMPERHNMSGHSGSYLLDNAKPLLELPDYSNVVTRETEK